WFKFFAKLTIGLIAIGTVFYFGTRQHDWLELRNTPMIRIGLLTLWLSLAGFVYLVTLWVTGFRTKDFLHQAK
ncbi:MAG: lipid II flippase MurJ, partial [Polynucleobacter victoriensis]